MPLRPALVQRPLDSRRRDFASLAARLSADLMRERLAVLAERLRALDRLRETLGHVATLRRGFAVVRADGVVVTGAGAARAARRLEIEFADGTVAATPDA